MGGIMFLRERSTQAEYFDSLRSSGEVAEFYRSLRGVNRFFLNSEPFRRSIPLLLGADTCACLSILDLGAGDGSLGEDLSQWAKRKGWHWQVTSLDLNPMALENGAGHRIVGSALRLPFSEDAFDVVIASQMTHHLPWDQIPMHFLESWRVARKAVIISDLHRNVLLYVTLFVVLRLQGYSREFIRDGLISVKRGWRLNEMRDLVARSGIHGLQVRLYYAARVLVMGHKGS
jgi:hypothetical protein